MKEKTNKSAKTKTKGTTTTEKSNEDSTTTTSESGWRSPKQLKQDVQTIIDIMGPPLSPTFNYNTSSEADNEESFLSNSKFSTEITKTVCDCNNKEPCSCLESEKTYLADSTEAISKVDFNTSEKTDSAELTTSNGDINISTAADFNTSVSPTMEDLTDPKVNFPYEENFCNNNNHYNICPPPLMPANVCINSECFCPQVSSILHGKAMQPIFNTNPMYQAAQANFTQINSSEQTIKSTKVNKIKEKYAVFNWLKAMLTSKSWENCKCNQNEYYKMNVKKNRCDDGSPPRRVVFELVDDIPKIKEQCEPCGDVPIMDGEVIKKKKNVKNERLQTRADQQCFCANKDCVPDSRKSKKPVEKTTYSDSTGKTRVDVYYFDHGSYNHYQTTDAPPLVKTEEIADLTEKHTTRFWAEIFGSIHIGFSFATSFILQLFRFILYSIFRPLTIGLVQLASDYFFKPLLATIFNGILQPLLIFLYNILATLRDICDPVAEGFGYFLRELAILIRAFRLVEVTNDKCKYESSKCDKKVKKDYSMC